jgi:AraC family transcriptional activator FtrA
MSQGFSHRVVAIVTEESNPFEMGVATELFGLRRPELDRPWYDFTLCAATPSVRMNLGMFTLSAVAGIEAADTADTLIVPARPNTRVPTAPAITAAIRRAAERG